MLFVAFPTSANAQAVFPECMECAFSHYPGSEFPSWACQFVESGEQDCAQWGNRSTHNCEATGGGCNSSAMGGPAEEQAVQMVMAGEMLPGDGNHYFITDGQMTFVKRKCDNSVVAQLYRDVAQDIMVARTSLPAEIRTTTGGDQ